MKKIVTVLAFLLSLLGLSACGSSNLYTFTLDESYDGFITLGTSADYAPYEWIKKHDGKQSLVGIDIEIAKSIAHAMKKNLKVVNKGFDFLLEDLKQGKVDFVLAGMTPTEKRKEEVDFSKVYYEAIQVVLVHESKLGTYQTFEDLNQSTIRIGAQLGSIQQELADTFTNAQKQYIQTIPDLMMRLSDGQIDAVIVEKPVADGYVKNQDNLGISSITIGDPEGGSAVAVQKGNEAFLEVINAVIDELVTSGKMDSIVYDMIQLNS
ncbi:MAG: transporter substrate-binding domain-containing protein [Acholeplasma sp.]|nr:transporter substrate-binding domain-containing protein [Acholeplasma sp.]